MGWFRCKADVMVFEVVDEVGGVTRRRRLTVPSEMTVDEIERLLVVMEMIDLERAAARHGNVPPPRQVFRDR